MQYAIALEMKCKCLRYSHSLAEAVVLQKQFTTALSSCCADQSNVVLSHCLSSESLAPSSDSFVKPTSAVTLQMEQLELTKSAALLDGETVTTADVASAFAIAGSIGLSFLMSARPRSQTTPSADDISFDLLGKLHSI